MLSAKWHPDCSVLNVLTHWGRVTHISVSKTIIIGSDNNLSPAWRQVIIGTNVGILLTGPLGTNFMEIWIEIHTFSFKKMHLKMPSGKWRPYCLGLNMLSGVGDWLAGFAGIIWESSMSGNHRHIMAGVINGKVDGSSWVSYVTDQSCGRGLVLTH